MDALSTKKEFPSQTENRKQWIIDTVRNNQDSVSIILGDFHIGRGSGFGKIVFGSLHKHDQDALLITNGILTDEQIEILSPGRLSPDSEADQ